MLHLCSRLLHKLRGSINASFSIGLPTSRLAKEKDRLVVEYALRDLQEPIGVADWDTLVEMLPEELKGSLPTVAEIEAELAPKRRRR